VEPVEPRSTILILDRSFDMITPFIHDYNYQSIVFDYLELGDRGEVTVNLGKDGAAPEKKKVLLGPEDPIWELFKGLQI